MGGTGNFTGHGPVACAKRLLERLGTPRGVHDDGSDAVTIGGEAITVGEGGDERILHALRDRLRLRKWRAAAERRPDMGG